MLFVDDTDAGLMGAAGDGLDVFCRLALLCELGVDSFGSFDGGLGVEFGWKDVISTSGSGSVERLYLGMRL